MARLRTNVTNSEGSCSCRARNGIGTDFVFKETKAAENPLMTESTTTTTATKSTPDYYRAQHQRDTVRQVLRSYSCCSSNRSNEVFSSIRVHPLRRRTPVASLATQGALAPGSKRRNAVLPNRERRILQYKATASSKDQCRLYHTAAKNDLVELLVQRGITDTKAGGKLVEKYLRKQSIGRRTYGAGTQTLFTEGREAETCVPKCHGIDSATIFKQLTILKRGGYWEHLHNGTMQEEDHQSNEGRPSDGRQDSMFRKEDDKENVPRASHANTGGWNNLQDLDEDEEYWEEVQTYRNRINPFVGSALASNKRNGTSHERIGFRVDTIAEDGWICCPEGSWASSSNNHDDGSNNESSLSTIGSKRQQQPSLLLHLPNKVAALGKQGMLVRGLDLMKRRDNGVLEPCNHRADGSHGSVRGFARDPSREDSLFGWISL